MADPRSSTAARLGAVVILAALTLVGAGLRLYDLDGDSFWRDEIETRVLVEAGYADMTNLALRVPPIPVPPLSFWVTRLLSAAPYDPRGLRLPAAFFGVLLIPVVWLLGRELLGGGGAGWAAAMTAASPFLLRYSQEARAYSLLALLVTLAALFLARALRTGSRSAWFGFAVAAAASLWTHHFALLAVAAAGLVTLTSPHRVDGARGPRRLLRTWPVWLLVIVAWLPLARHLSRGLSGPRGLAPVETGLNAAWADLPALVAVLGPAGYPWAWGVAVLALLGLVSAAPWKPGGRRLVLLWLAVPVLIAVVVPFHHALRLRYLIYVIPAWFLLAAAGTDRLLESVRKTPLGRLAAWCLVAVLAWSTAVGLQRAFAEGRQDWRSGALFLRAALGPDDVVLVDGRARERLNLRRHVLDLYAGLAERVVIYDPRDIPGERLTPAALGSARLWYYSSVEPRTDSGGFMPGDAEAFVSAGWRLLPTLKFDTPVFLSAPEIDWIGPTRYRSVAVVPLERADLPPDPAELERLIALAKGIPGAHLDEPFVRRQVGGDR